MPHAHNCYFHQNNLITHFCTKLNCTLPMCQKCLPIHLQEHQTHNPNQGIVSFQEALSNAITTLKSSVSKQFKYKSQSIAKMQEARTKIMRKIDQLFSNFRVKIQEYFTITSQAEKKLVKIQKGSLKTLIYFYSQEQKNINQRAVEQNISKILKFQKNFTSVIESEQSIANIQVSSLNHLENKIQTKEQNFKGLQCYNRERGQSFDGYYGLNNNSKSTANLMRMQTAKFNNIQIQQVERKLSKQNSKALLRDNAHGQSYTYLQTNRSYQNKQNQDMGTHFLENKVDTEAERKREIQRIRQRQQQRKRQRQRQIQLQRQKQIEKQRQMELQRQRQRERERQKQIQKQFQMQRQLELQKQMLKQRQWQQQKQHKQKQLLRHKQFNISRAYQKNEKQSIKGKQLIMIKQRCVEQNQLNSQNYGNFTYKNTQINQYEIGKYNGGNNIQRQLVYTRVQHQSVKKPLEMADLNVQTKVQVHNIYGQKNKFGQKKFVVNDNIYEMNKQVLSPEQIRKMLQKRIQERSRLINKNRSLTPPKSLVQQQQSKMVKAFNRSKQLINNTPINILSLESETKWDTKDSIINQIYDDYRN